MEIALIAAVARNGVVGRDNALPWHLPEDLKYFKRVTLGKPILMGRLTWESIGRPLPGRRNIVLTRAADLVIEGVDVVRSLDEALALVAGEPQLMVIGGAQLYAEALPRAQRLLITEVHAEFEGDTFFPDWPREEWREVSRESHTGNADGAPDCSFVVYERATGVTGASTVAS